MSAGNLGCRRVRSCFSEGSPRNPEQFPRLEARFIFEGRLFSEIYIAGVLSTVDDTCTTILPRLFYYFFISLSLSLSRFYVLRGFTERRPTRHIAPEQRF